MASSAGQAFQTAYVGLKWARFGQVTVGRQVTLVSEGTINTIPTTISTAFGLLGASKTYSGAGSSEDNRLDDVLKYSATFDDRVHVGAMYKFNGSTGEATPPYQAGYRRRNRRRLRRCVLFEGQRCHLGFLVDRRSGHPTAGFGIFLREFPVRNRLG